MDNFGNQVIAGGNAQLQTQQAAQVVDQAGVNNQVNTPESQGIRAMFTQEQLNSIISGRVNPLNQRIQELTAQLTQSQQLSQSYLNELTGLKNRELAMSEGVPAQFVDFAVFEASKLAINGKSFGDALKEYVSSNGQLFGMSTPSNQAVTTATPSGVATTQEVANPAQTTQAQQPAVNATTQVVNNTGNTGNTVTYGATNLGTAGNIANTSNIDSEVEAFLKLRGLRK